VKLLVEHGANVNLLEKTGDQLSATDYALIGDGQGNAFNDIADYLREHSGLSIQMIRTKAATSIQSAFRGFKARQGILMKHPERKKFGNYRIKRRTTVDSVDGLNRSLVFSFLTLSGIELHEPKGSRAKFDPSTVAAPKLKKIPSQTGVKSPASELSSGSKASIKSPPGELASGSKTSIKSPPGELASGSKTNVKSPPGELATSSRASIKSPPAELAAASRTSLKGSSQTELKSESATNALPTIVEQPAQSALPEAPVIESRPVRYRKPRNYFSAHLISFLAVPTRSSNFSTRRLFVHVGSAIFVCNCAAAALSVLPCTHALNEGAATHSAHPNQDARRHEDSARMEKVWQLNRLF
jgi:hypothetical protein